MAMLPYLLPKDPNGNVVSARGGLPGLDVALGFYPALSLFEKFGANTDVDTATDPEDIWNGGGLYTGFPTGSAETIDVFSSSTDDDAAGDGLRTVRLYGQLAGVEQTEDVTLDGTTAVTTTNTWDRMYRVRGLTAGDDGVNAGAITCRHTTTTANVFAVVPAGSNRSQICAATVPAGKTLYLNSVVVGLVRASGAAGSASVALMVRESGGVWEQLFTQSVSTSSPSQMPFGFGVNCPALTDIVVRVLSVSDNNSEFTGQMFGVLVEDAA